MHREREGERVVLHKMKLIFCLCSVILSQPQQGGSKDISRQTIVFCYVSNQSNIDATIIMCPQYIDLRVFDKILYCQKMWIGR